MGPTECKYCGCNKFNADSVTMTRFRCGSSYWHNEEMWQVANGCAAKCAVQLVELRANVQRAVAVLEKGERFVDYTVSGEALEILRGNSPESPDSSPVTADQLSNEDYYEAVRQRVPWMVTVKHIVGLVEGYRQCGLMAWQTAKEIQRVYGSGK